MSKRKIRTDRIVAVLIIIAVPIILLIALSKNSKRKQEIQFI